MSKIPQTRENETFEQAFYGEMDKKTEKKSFCTCYTMAILFACLAVLIIAITIYFAKVVNQKNINVGNILPLVAEKISRDENISTKNPTLNLIVTADELNSILPQTLKSYSLSIENPQITLSSSGMLLTGQLITFIKIPVEMTALVLPKDGKVRIEIVKSKMGFISLPGMVRTGIENSLNELFDENFAGVYETYEVNNIEMGENQMTILGNLKK